MSAMDAREERDDEGDMSDGDFEEDAGAYLKLARAPQEEARRNGRFSVTATFSDDMPEIMFQLPLGNRAAVVEQIRVKGIDSLADRNRALTLKIGAKDMIKRAHFLNGEKNNNLKKRAVYPLINGDGVLFGMSQEDTEESVSILSIDVAMILREATKLPSDEHLVPMKHASVFERILVKNEMCALGDITDRQNPTYRWERNPDFFLIDGDVYTEIMNALQKKQREMHKQRVDPQTNIAIKAHKLCDEEMGPFTAQFDFFVKFTLPSEPDMEEAYGYYPQGEF